MVRAVGLEPTLLAEPDFESGASTNSTTPAYRLLLALCCFFVKGHDVPTELLSLELGDHGCHLNFCGRSVQALPVEVCVSVACTTESEFPMSGLPISQFADLLTPELVVTGVNVGNRKAAFGILAKILSGTTSLPSDRILSAFHEREQLGSTGFGGGVAIPHGRLAELDKMVGAFLLLPAPISYDAADGRPVDILFALLGPEDAGVQHLKTLASISRALRDRGFTDRLRGVHDGHALYAILCGADEREAA